MVRLTNTCQIPRSNRLDPPEIGNFRSVYGTPKDFVKVTNRKLRRTEINILPSLSSDSLLK